MVFAVSGGAVAQVASVPSDADQGDGLEVENAKRFFDMERDNAMRDILLPHVVSWLQADVSPGLNDASILFRYFTILFNVAFDAVAPYDETAVGVYSRLERRPSWESVNNRRPNVAVMYAVYHSMIEFAPHRTEHWRRMMTLRGLDPDAPTDDQSTPAGVGYAAARGVLDARRHDGFNQFGDETPRVPLHGHDGLRAGEHGS